MKDIVSRIQSFTLEEIMGDRFGKYSKYIIQDRALPDVRDGLKPVQRRILYGMYRGHFTYDKPYVKSARSVGDVMGKYHPHGDSSIYDAMVRMSQWWKQNITYIDMQGNNGSMDGDGAAAMRYTEARLSKICNCLMKDIDRGTITWAPNFDDQRKEPTVLPAKFPNLLVNGSSGISAGYATNIPPHNLIEVIDATIKRIESPNCRFETILDTIKGPDFPTGGIIENKAGIIDAFKTGRGKVVIKSKYEFTKEKSKDKVLITEIPFDVNKQNLVKKIEEIKIDKKVEGIADVRDESDREDPVRIVIDFKKGADKELVMNYLLKNTDLMINYNYNMTAIVNRRPKQLGILEILDAYIEHLKDVIINRTKFDLEEFRARCHILEGLIKALSILDEVIALIRASKNKANAKENLIKEFGFTQIQAEAIVVLQLYKLTNTDVEDLRVEFSDLKNKIKILEEILADEEKLKIVMKGELKKIKTEYGTPRKSLVSDAVTEIKIDTNKMIKEEDCIAVVTSEGYVKRVSLRSYDNSIETLCKDGDYPILQAKCTTKDVALIFTNKGNYMYVPIHELPDMKWKELGKHISNIISVRSDEKIIASTIIYDFNANEYITVFTKDGMTKRTKISDYVVSRYSKEMTYIKLKDEDIVVDVDFTNLENVFITTKLGYGLTYKTEEIPVSGVKAAGVKAIKLASDEVVSGTLYDDTFEYLTVITRSTGKRIKLSEFELTSRARKGVLVVRDVKTNPYYIVKSLVLNYKESINVKTIKDTFDIKLTSLKVADRYSTGNSLSKEKIIDVYQDSKMIEKDKVEKSVEKENISIEELDKKMLTIDDFLDKIE